MGRYVPIRDYAVIGDGRTVALVARDGAIDWLCLPNMDSPSVFAAILDAERGGSFELCPTERYETTRRYRPGTNVLETTFTTTSGSVRVTDAMTLPDANLGPLRELARRVEGLSGRVAMRWQATPRFDYGRRARLERRGEIPVASHGSDGVAFGSWDAGAPEIRDGAVSGRFEMAAGRRALLGVIATCNEPLVFPPRADVEARLDATTAFWERWSGHLTYAGPWRDAVVRSALALKLLVFAPSGAITAAPTTSLPEAIGGERNWDYRYCWIRDSSFTIEALLQLGCDQEATSFFWWFMHATRLTSPRLRVLYRLDGGAHVPERVLDHLSGYRGSRPVRIGNAAAGQLQLDTFGELLDAAFGYVRRGARIDRDTMNQLAELADFVADHWRDRDAGIWEVRMEPQHFTESKAMCWVALDRAAQLAETGHLSGRRRQRWLTEAAAIRAFIDDHCWSERLGSYVRYAGREELDASLLMMPIMRYDEPTSPRLAGTIEAVRRELGRGALVYRYTGEDGLAGAEGVFVCCSFWLAEALALAGRRDDAARSMDAALLLANDVGLFSEELDPASGEFLGNFPQGLVHLAIISAAAAIARLPS
jgi:GH15 family glucan-1,4-alpha-glucosidase